MLWVKAFHIVFMVAWFAGLFYLPRLFVYHADTAEPAGRQRFEVMERRLLVLTHIAAVATIAFGVWLLWLVPGYLQQGWLHAKLALVLLLIGFQVACRQLAAAFRAGRNRHGSRWFRVFNELPTLLLIGIVVLAVVRPF